MSRLLKSVWGGLTGSGDADDRSDRVSDGVSTGSGEAASGGGPPGAAVQDMSRDALMALAMTLDKRCVAAEARLREGRARYRALRDIAIAAREGLLEVVSSVAPAAAEEARTGLRPSTTAAGAAAVTSTAHAPAPAPASDGAAAASSGGGGGGGGGVAAVAAGIRVGVGTLVRHLSVSGASGTGALVSKLSGAGADVAHGGGDGAPGGGGDAPRGRGEGEARPSGGGLDVEALLAAWRAGEAVRARHEAAAAAAALAAEEARASERAAWALATAEASERAGGAVGAGRTSARRAPALGHRA